MNIIVSGGGTGGHIYPALTIIRTLQILAPDTNFLYVGTKAGLESDIIPKEGLPFATIELEGFERHLTPSNLVRAGKAMKGVMCAMKIVKDFRPDVVIGTGGYVCGPILLAASLRRIPTLIQEQNVVPGITNKILSKFVTKVAVGTPEAAKNFPKSKTIFTEKADGAGFRRQPRRAGDQPRDDRRSGGGCSVYAGTVSACDRQGGVR